MNLWRIMRSNLWPVAAYTVMAFWLGVGLVLPRAVWLKLVPLNGVAHYVAAMSLALIAAELMKQRRALLMLLLLIVAWEVFEFLWFGTLLRNTVEDTRDLGYWTDTLSDLILGMAGILTGLYLNEPLNTSKA